MLSKLRSLDIFKAAAVFTILGVFIMTFQAAYPVWHDNQKPTAVPSPQSSALPPSVVRPQEATPAHAPVLPARVAVIPPRLPKAGEISINPIDGAERVWVPAGDFLMGDADEIDNPRHTVTLDGYYIYKNLVTVKQFRAYDAANGSKYDWVKNKPKWGWKDDHPMVNVSWEEAEDYCKWASGNNPGSVRLPTEAQWEKAARGTDGRRYPWGNDWDGSRLWHSKDTFGDAGSTAPVGSFPTGASPYGVLDMAGNVWQWCADWYDKDYFTPAPARNPTGPGTGTTRVLRGGSWNFTNPGGFRAAYRNRFNPAIRISNYGFRVASGL